MFTRIRSTITALFRRDRFEQDMADEMRFHMAAYARDLVRAGMSPTDAERRARLEFGAVESLREDCRQARGVQFFDTLRQDIRYATRRMARTPGFTVAVVLSLALGIGANTAIFSLMDAVLFRTLPVENPGALFFLEHRATTDTTPSANYPLFERYQAVDAFSGVTASDMRTFTVTTSDGKERIDGQYVSGNYHDVLGVPISIGRGFTNESDRPNAQSAIAVISDGYWERKFARDPNAVGRTLIVNERPVTIIGVTQPGFYGLLAGRRLDITLPLSLKVLSQPEFLTARDGWTSLTMIGRLKPGITESRALAAADAVFRPFWMEPENAWARDDAHDPPRSAVLVPAGNGSTDLRSRYARPLRVLMAMVGIVLLIACANVANLMLARAAARARDVAVRLSIGAERARLVRQCLTESLLYAIAGGVGGIVVAVASAGVLVSSFATGRAPMHIDVELNRRVLTFTIAVSLLTGIAFGLLPAFSATRVDLTRTLKDGAVGRAQRHRLATGKVLVAAQIALCVVVIAVAGLLVGTLRNLRTFDAGFARENILLFNLETGSQGFTPERRAAFYNDLETRFRGLPEVLSVSLSNRSPIDFSAETRGIVVPGVPPDRVGVSAIVATPAYFDVFGIPFVRGRGFTPQDRRGAQRVGVVNEAMARRYFGTADPIGRTFRFGIDSEFVTIVGVVKDVRHQLLREQSPATVYTALDQPTLGLDGKPETLGRVTIELRSRGDPRALAAKARSEVRALSTEATIWYTRTMQQQVDASLIRERLLANLSTGFGALALLLAFVGLYGVMSYRVARRAREIGVRMALGATQSLVVRQVLRETLRVAGSGIGIGLGLALLASKVVASFLFGVSPRDPAMFALVALTLFVIAVVAGILPARRAARVDPMSALRGE